MYTLIQPDTQSTQALAIPYYTLIPNLLRLQVYPDMPWYSTYSSSRYTLIYPDTQSTQALGTYTLIYPDTQPTPAPGIPWYTLILNLLKLQVYSDIPWYPTYCSSRYTLIYPDTQPYSDIPRYSTYSSSRYTLLYPDTQPTQAPGIPCYTLILNLLKL